MKIVADSSPLIAFAILDQLDLLPLIFAEIHIPRAVGDEISAPGKPHAQNLKEFSEGKILTVQNRVAVTLLANEIDLGEAETVALALENAIENVLIDDAKGRKAAQRNGLHPIGTIGVLLQAKKLGHIEAIKPSLDKLISEKIRIGNKLYLQALVLAGEQQVI